MTVETVQLEAESLAIASPLVLRWQARPKPVAATGSPTRGRNSAPRDTPGRRPTVSEPSTATIPLVPRSFAHLPSQRWCWAARRRLAQDHPFGRIGRIEASLEQLVGELEAEVDRLVARTGELLDDQQST